MTMPDHIRLDDVDIYISGNPTPEGDKAFSEFLKAYREKEASSKKARTTPSRAVAAARKKAKAK